MEGDAILSSDRHYRYLLTRKWREEGPRLLYIMLNPSTADASVDDPTIRRCIAFGMDWGFSRLEVVNLFAWRATDAKELRNAPDPVGPINDYVTLEAVQRADLIVAAWGANSFAVPRSRVVRALVKGCDKPLYCLGKTQGFAPRHPLYVAAGTKYQIYS